MSARYNFRHQADVAADISRCRADTEPLLFSDIGPTSSLYRPDVGLISLTTSGRHRAHVQTLSRPDISRHLPMSARYNFRHRADVTADISRYRADIWPIVLCYLGMMSSGISLMNSRNRSGPNTLPCGIPLVTCDQLESAPFTTTL